MKITKLGTSAMATALTAGLLLTGCSSDSADKGSGTSSAASASASAAPSAGDTATAPALPTAADLNAILAKATDPNVTMDEKTATVQGGETAPEIFDVMAQAQVDSGATFQVEEPVLPGYTPDSVLTTVTLNVPGQPPQVADSVEFIFEGGQWKLAQSWACTLISNTVAPEQVPAMCAGTAPAAPAADAAAPAAPAAPAADAAAPAPAPAQ